MEVKQSVQFDALVKMVVSATGAGKTGLVYTDMTVYLQKQGGSSTVKALASGAEWVEVDATNMPGVYRLRLTTGNLDTTGYLAFGVAASTCDTFIGVLEVVANIESDTYTRLGAPAGASIAADIAASGGGGGTVYMGRI